jgi:uncharacterized membrane protein
MRIPGLIAGTLILVTACEGAGDGNLAAAGNDATQAATANSASGAPPANAVEPAAAPRWDLQSSGDGVALALLAEPGGAAVRLFCPARQGRLLVNVAAFRPVGSEERLSIGSGGEAHALVADSRGDRRRGGVTGAGVVPDNLAALIGGPFSVSYGAQRSGAHPAPPRELASAFVAACRERTAAARPPAPPAAAASPCLVQDGQPLRVAPVRAVGTEPFWGARIEGRCVIYSHPDDQDGTRIWTRYSAGPDGAGIWAGALGGRRFELRTRAQPGCSDGMSDRRYPIAVDLIVAGERRSGCAEPL